MKTLHEKSACCHAQVWRFGRRRRQCSACGKTWSVWKRKRGRKRSRPDKKLLKKIFIERQRLRDWLPIKKSRIGIGAASRRLRTAIHHWLKKPPKLSWTANGYLLVTDALWFCFNKQRWTLYLIASRSTNGNRLRFIPPVLLPGREGLKGWKLAIDTLSAGLKSRVRAIVSDGWRGVEGLAKKHGWLLQRCHFHFISQLQVNRGRWKHLPDQRIREEIYQTARRLLTVRGGTRFYKERLYSLVRQPTCPRRLRLVINDFIRRLKHFRLYLNKPELNLPATTNSMESMNRIIKERCRYLRTPQALRLWSILLVRLHKKIKCNGANHQQN